MSSRLDYCNSLFLSLTDFELRRLQLVPNSLCRVVTHFSIFSHITPQLKKLHWLPVIFRVQFKIGIITYKILNQGPPVYLRELCPPHWGVGGGHICGGTGPHPRVNPMERVEPPVPSPFSHGPIDLPRTGASLTGAPMKIEIPLE